MIGENIREQRKLKGLTQKELAEKSGISLSAIEKYERGKLNPSLGKVKDIAKALNINYTTLVPVSSIEELDLNETAFEKFIDVHLKGFMYDKAPEEAQDKIRKLFEQCLVFDGLVERKEVEKKFDNPVTVASIFYDYISRKQAEHEMALKDREDRIKRYEEIMDKILNVHDKIL